MTRDTKEQIVDEVIAYMMSAVPDYKREIISLLKEALLRHTYEDLKKYDR